MQAKKQREFMISKKLIKLKNNIKLKLKTRLFKSKNNASTLLNHVYISPYHKLRTPQMKHFAELNISKEHKIEILTNQYRTIYAKNLRNSKLIRYKIKSKIKEKIDLGKDFLLGYTNFDYRYIPDNIDAKYNAITKTSFLIAISNTLIFLYHSFNNLSSDKLLMFLGASTAVLGICGFVNYTKVKQKYLEEDIYDMLFILQQENNQSHHK